MAILIGASGWQSGALSGLRQVNPLLLTAGAMGASLVFGIAWLIPQIGAGPMTMMLLGGRFSAAWRCRTSAGLGLPCSRSH
jgi:transporter family-2 protein